jgi:type IV pilus assembly protein PilZ
MTENRQHPRAPIELRVDYRKLNAFFADYTKNISKGGTFIKTRKALPVGTRFLFRLAVPGRADPFELSGEVVHASPQGADAGMGIRFVWAQEADRRGFEQVVERLMAESLGPTVAQRLLQQSRGKG